MRSLPQGLRERAPRRASRRAGQPRIHARGEERLDAILDLAEIASADASLPDTLHALVGRIATLLAVDVCSIYLRERSDDDRRATGDLVLAATHGYEADAVGRVRMRVGEGLTGFAVECMRPVSVARALADARNRTFAFLDEERYPALCAVPLVDGGRAVGALVIQRRQARAFGQREVVLAASLAAPVLFALAKERERQRDRSDAQRAPGRVERPHDVTLTGLGVAPGLGLGTVVVRAVARPVRQKGARDTSVEKTRLLDALLATGQEILALERWAEGQLSLTAMNLMLSPARFIIDDARLRGRMLSLVERGALAEEAVATVMREYTRHLTATGDALLHARALEVEHLCMRLSMRLSDGGGRVAPGTVLISSRITVYDALELAANHGVGAVTAQAAGDQSGVAVLVALGVPVVTAVPELFRWVAAGDRALVDGARGVVIVNPSCVDEVNYRRQRA